MLYLKSLIAIAFAASLLACAQTNGDSDSTEDLGILWVKHAAEYQAVSAQVYAEATRDLAGFVSDNSWSAMPGHSGESGLPTAVILDVDETVVSNVNFQATFEQPFTDRKLDVWDSKTETIPVRGVVEFVAAARAAGVTVIFLTNRPCQQIGDNSDPCPQKQTVVDGINEIGIAVTPEFVMLSDERPDWGREKVVRREFVAETYRVIMLIGDDLGDFIRCTRNKPAGPCKAAATRESRLRDLEKYQQYWGNGWYILPNPMHGSWTSVE